MKKDNWFQASQRSQLSPFPNYLSEESITKEMKQLFGFGYKKVMFIFQGNNFWGCFLKKDYQRVADGLFRKIKENPGLFKILVSRQKKFGKIFLKHIKQWTSQDLNRISNKKLIEFSKQYAKEYKRIYSNYFIILSVEQVLTRYLYSYILKKFRDQSIASDYFNKLTTEPSAMVNKQENIAALKLTALIKKNKRWIKILKSRKAEELIKKDRKLYNLVKNHERKWFWLTRDYENEILTFSDFIERFKEHLKAEPDKKLADIKRELAVFRQEVKEIKIDKDHQRLFEAMRDGIYLKELRKSIVSQSLYYYDPILSEIARRGRISLRQVRFLLTEEIARMLLEGKDFTPILNERMKLSLYITSAGITKIIVSRPAKKIFKKICKVPKNVRKLRGLPVSPGKARGRVKIVINPAECRKVKPGDIIVTGQATPAFSRAIAIAAGLVADGGTGITSHPATLAREAKIPCVTGAKIATKILKDGDKVEVDGDRGIIRILK